MSKLREKRNEKGFTQSQLSDLSGIKFQVVQQYETGYRNIDGAKLDTLLKLAAALDCRIYEILEDPELQKQLVKYENKVK